ILILLFTNSYAHNPLDSKLPIEVNADNMTVDQQQSIAVLSGNVEASQGSMNITSDLMRIYYQKNVKNPDDSSISRIEVEGNINMKTAKEKIKSQWGVYDVNNALITLKQNVTLIKDNNVIKGDMM